MHWITQFTWFLGVPGVVITLCMLGGWLSDNLSYEWKHYTKKETIGCFLIGPTVALLSGGLAMSAYLLMDWHNGSPFIFERWWTALTFVGLSLSLIRGPVSWETRSRSPEEERRRDQMRIEWERQHP